MGRLTGKYSEENPPPPGRHFSDVSMAELKPLLETMRRIGDKYNVSVSSVALNYVICKGMEYSMLLLYRGSSQCCSLNTLFCFFLLEYEIEISNLEYA